MSQVYVYRIDGRGVLDRIGDAPNAHTYHVAIWHQLMLKHGILPPGSGPTLNLPKLGELWMRVATLPRVDGLLNAATFDRAWFPRSMSAELLAAFDTAAFAPTCASVAAIVRGAKWSDRDRGVCFGSSLNNAWNCHTNDGTHRLGKGGHKCRDCGKRLQNAQHMLRNDECCRETDDPNAYRDDTLDGVR